MIGREFGLIVERAVILADSNNVVVWLAPSPVVAKVGTGHHRSLRLELRVARHLVGQRAPVVAPLDQVRDVLARSGQSPALDEADRKLLLDALDQFRAELDSYGADQHALHGSPHSSNVLVVGGAPRFIDFETACRGPIEWDLAHLDSEVAAGYPIDCDDRVRASCAALVSVKTVAWC